MKISGQKVHYFIETCFLQISLIVGGIEIGDRILIGPRAKLISVNHPLNPQDRHKLELKSVIIGRNVWIGADATILPGVTVGDNAVVAAGALVSKDVPANTLVAGLPAKVIKQIP